MSLSAECNVTSTCTAGTPITLRVDPFYGNCFPPSTWCGPGYSIQACDRLTWHFDDGTPDAVVTGSSTIQHTFPNPRLCNVTADIENSAGRATVQWSPVVITSSPPTTITYSVPATIHENDGTAVVSLTRGGNTTTSARVRYFNADNLPDGTASGPFRAASGAVTFAPGETSKTISFPLTNDNIYSGDGGYRVGLAADDGTIFGTWAATNFYLMYVDDDPPPSASVADTTVIEGTGGTNAAEFTITTSAPMGRDYYFSASVQSGTATIVDDFGPSKQSEFGWVTGCNLARGTTSCKIFVPIVTDQDPEPDETFTLTIGPSYDAWVHPLVARRTATCTIIDDDNAPHVFMVQPLVRMATAGDTTLTISLQPPRVTPETVLLTVADPAIIRAPQSVVIPPGGEATVTLQGVHAGSTSLLLNWVNGRDAAFGSVTVNVKDPARRRAM